LCLKSDVLLEREPMRYYQARGFLRNDYLEDENSRHSVNVLPLKLKPKILETWRQRKDKEEPSPLSDPTRFKPTMYTLGNADPSLHLSHLRLKQLHYLLVLFLF
jgi:hypothetical protein